MLEPCEKKFWIADGRVPVYAVVDRYLPGSPARLDGHPDLMEPGDGPDVEWHLETTKGFAWSGLLDLATPWELADINGELEIMLEKGECL